MYYSEKLSADRLRRCYEIASPRIQAYLEAEIRFVLEVVPRKGWILDLGCGYGRVLARMAGPKRGVLGIDASITSLQAAAGVLRHDPRICLAAMDAACLAFGPAAFDAVVCIQNGLSAFQADPRELMKEALRVARPGAPCLFSSYAERFWPERLAWFERQAEEGLLGEIDREATGSGVIVCKDGFRAVTFGPKDFERLAASLGRKCELVEVDGSSLFCVVTG